MKCLLLVIKILHSRNGVPPFTFDTPDSALWHTAVPKFVAMLLLQARQSMHASEGDSQCCPKRVNASTPQSERRLHRTMLSAG